MVRTANEIEESIDIEAEKYNELDALQNNGSMVSFWTYVKKIVVFTVLTLERFFDQHKKDIDSIIEKTETGSLEWYLSLSNSYQHGDGLIVQNNRPVYATKEASRRIIKRVSLRESDDAVLHFKVVKEKSGKLVKLDEIELVSFKAYMNLVKIAGTKLNIDSLDANKLILRVDVTLDSLLFNEEGKLLVDDTKEPVLEAVNTHLQAFDFGGVFYLSKLINATLKVPGVKDFHIESTEMDGDVFERKKESTAGYIELHEDTNISYVLS